MHCLNYLRATFLLAALLGTATARAEEAYWSSYITGQGFAVLLPQYQNEQQAAKSAFSGSASVTCASWEYDYNDPNNGNYSGPVASKSTNGTNYDYPLKGFNCTTAGYNYPVRYLRPGYSMRKTVCDTGYVATVFTNFAATCSLPSTAPLPAASEDPGIPNGQSLPTDCPRGTCPVSASAIADIQGARSLDGPPRSDSGLVSDPVNIATGNTFQQEVDYAGNGGNKLLFYRVYNSSNAAVASTVSGVGWRHNFERRVLYNSYYAQLIRADGQSVAFTKSGSSYVPPLGHKGTLSALMNGSTQIGWRYVYPNLDIEEFDYPAGRLQSVQFKTGAGYALTWVSGYLTAIADGLGRSVQLTYQGGVLSRATFPDGTWANYGYDGYRRLVSVSRSNGTVRQYSYGPVVLAGAQNPAADLLLGITDEDGIVAASFAYDANRRAMTVSEANGSTYATFTYGSGTTTVTTSKGYAETYELTPAGDRQRAYRRSTTCSDGCALAGQVLEASYDDNGNRTSILGKSGVLTCVAYNQARNLPLVRIEGLIGGVDTCSAALASPPPYGRTTSWQWHATMAVPLAVAGPQAITTYQLDTAGRPLTVSVQPTSDMSGAAGFSAQATGAARTWQYTYTARGSLTSVKAPRGDVNATTTFSYDGAENLISVTDPVGLVTAFGSYDANGRPGLITEPNGLQTTVGYDARGRVAQVNRGGATTSYSYTPAGRLASTTLSSGLTLTYGYGAAGRVNQVADSAGNRTDYVLDSEGNVTSETVTGNGNALAFSRQMAYDALSRLTTLTKAQ